MRAADRAEIARHAKALFRGADSAGYVLLRAFRGDSTQPWRYLAWSGIRVGEDLAGVIDAAAGLAEAAAESGENIVFWPPVATFRDAAGAGVANLCEGLVICFDCDKGRPREGLGRLEALLGPATLVVASRGITDGGEDKLRLYWRLQVSTRTAEEHAQGSSRQDPPTLTRHRGRPTTQFDGPGRGTSNASRG